MTGIVAAITGAGVAAGGNAGPRAPRAVPTISVTPHSPGILEETIQQVQQINQVVNQMRYQEFNRQVRVIVYV